MGEKARLGFEAPYKADFIDRMNTAIQELQKSGAVERGVAEYTREQ
jgi:hypothetical protein